MFLLLAPLALAGLGLAGGAAGSLFGGGSPDFGGIMEEIAKQAQSSAFGSKSKQFPVYDIQTPGGGRMQSGVRNFANFNKTPGFLKNILAGKKGKNLSPEALQAIRSNPGKVDMSMLTEFAKNKLKGKGAVGKPEQFLNYQPEEKAQQGFDFLQDAYLKQIEQQNKMNQFITGAMLPNLMGFQNKATSAAGNLIDQGFTENSPFAQQQIKQAQEGFFNEGQMDLQDAFKNNLEYAKSIINDNGFGPMGSTTGDQGFIQKAALKPFADGMSRLQSQSQQFGHQLAQDWLGNRRSAFSTLLQAPGMNAGIQGLQAPGLPVDPTLLSPTGLFSPEFLQNAAQFNANYGLQRDQQRQAPLLAGIPGAMQLAGQPSGTGATLGSLFGGVGGSAANLAILKSLFPTGLGK